MHEVWVGNITRWWQLKDSWNFHPDPWGASINSSAWSLGWFLIITPVWCFARSQRQLLPPSPRNSRGPLLNPYENPFFSLKAGGLKPLFLGRGVGTWPGGGRSTSRHESKLSSTFSSGTSLGQLMETLRHRWYLSPYLNIGVSPGTLAAWFFGPNFQPCWWTLFRSGVQTSWGC